MTGLSGLCCCSTNSSEKIQAKSYWLVDFVIVALRRSAAEQLAFD